ncbi:hypothetical protein EB815_20705 [Mesorhizobium loti]|nr:hypothetical protein EB815_20705 [Mesorhizobium loti]
MALSETAQQLLEIANELEAAAKHVITAHVHFSGGEVPRGCAHVLALEGHILRVRHLLDDIQLRHAEHARP